MKHENRIRHYAEHVADALQQQAGDTVIAPAPEWVRMTIAKMDQDLGGPGLPGTKNREAIRATALRIADTEDFSDLAGEGTATQLLIDLLRGRAEAQAAIED